MLDLDVVAHVSFGSFFRVMIIGWACALYIA